MILIWQSHPVILKHWLPNLDAVRRNPVAAVSPELAVMCATSFDLKGAVGGVAAGLKGLRERGVSGVPALILVSGESMHHTYATWFDKTLWQRYAERLKEVAALRAPGDDRVAFDLEPYWDQEPRYPLRGADEYRYLEAVQPLIAALKAEGVAPLIAPGGLEYTSVVGWLVALTNAAVLDETTYGLPEGAGTWQNYEVRKAAITAIGRRYLPGFYAVALRKPSFQAELRGRGITDYWIFPRAKEDRPEDFFLPQWSTATSAPSTQPG